MRAAMGMENKGYIQIYRWKNLLNFCAGREISRDEEESEELDWDIWDLYGDHGDAL